MFEQSISVDRMEQAVSLFGSFDENIKMIEKEFNVGVVSRGSEIKVTGEAENVSKGVRAINGLLMLINRGEALSDQNVRYVISLVNEGNEDQLPQMTADCICITSKGRPVKPKTLGQKKYIEAIRKIRSLSASDRRHRQNLSCGRHGGDGFSSKGSQPYNSYPPRS